MQASIVPYDLYSLYQYHQQSHNGVYKIRLYYTRIILKKGRFIS